jgi:hypothetical protein
MARSKVTRPLRWLSQSPDSGYYTAFTYRCKFVTVPIVLIRGGSIMKKSIPVLLAALVLAVTLVPTQAVAQPQKKAEKPTATAVSSIRWPRPVSTGDRPRTPPVR